jgi:hypothetical protein
MVSIHAQELLQYGAIHSPLDISCILTRWHIYVDGFGSKTMSTPRGVSIPLRPLIFEKTSTQVLILLLLSPSSQLSISFPSLLGCSCIKQVPSIIELPWNANHQILCFIFLRPLVLKVAIGFKVC